MQFADYITSILEKFIENLGQTFLKSPRESASELFKKLIQENSSDWDEEADSLDEESDEQETWKFGNMGIAEVVEDSAAVICRVTAESAVGQHGIAVPVIEHPTAIICQVCTEGAVY